MKAVKTCMVAVAIMAGSAFAGSADIAICRNPETSLLWKTVASDNPSVALSWPDGAVKARLEVSGGNGGTYEITDTTLDSYAVPLTLPTKDPGEDVVTLQLDYLGAEDAVISSETARLGLVRGTVNGEAIRFTPEVNVSMTTRSPVLMVPDGASYLTVNGAAADVTAPDWYKLADNGGYALTLGWGDETLERFLTFTGAGLLLILK